MRGAWKQAWLGLLTLAGMASIPAAVSAGELGFRNDTEAPVIVQGMSIIRGKIFAGKRHVLQPGDVGWDNILAAGNKLVIIADAKQPTKTLYQGTITFQFAGNTQFYSIKAIKDPPPKKKPGDKPGKPQKQTPPRIDIELTTPPARGNIMPRR
jgi:hypothetical protein